MIRMMIPRVKVRFERWKYNKIYGIYVSNLGNFRDKRGIVIKPLVDPKSGYLTIKLKYGWEFAHRLVAFTWLPTEDMYHLTVDHKDHNKRNNEVRNLEFCTQEENQARAKQDLAQKEIDDLPADSPFEILSRRVNKNGETEEKIFSSYREAAQFIKTNEPTNKLLTEQQIIHKLSSFAAGGHYCGFYWQLRKKVV